MPQLHANNLGFAILADESAGNPDCGGQLRSSRSAHKLVGHRNFEVGRLRSYDAPLGRAFAAFLAVGSLGTQGMRVSGWNISAVQD